MEMKNEIKSYAKDRECMLKVSTPSVVTSFTNGAFFQSAATEMSNTFSVLGECGKDWKGVRFHPCRRIA